MSQQVTIEDTRINVATAIPVNNVEGHPEMFHTSIDTNPLRAGTDSALDTEYSGHVHQVSDESSHQSENSVHEVDTAFDLVADDSEGLPLQVTQVLDESTWCPESLLTQVKKETCNTDFEENNKTGDILTFDLDSPSLVIAVWDIMPDIEGHVDLPVASIFMGHEVTSDSFFIETVPTPSTLRPFLFDPSSANTHFISVAEPGFSSRGFKNSKR
ncbi:uncharacterized protein LOC132603123 [Lycium barbarum]|uniref:uncharacterized protein LOC132603123 n=1 Tax=Lycium barbarum TaxID=112863 RepID=UPI00293EB23E|nr:uncharacterized protein LOC132603123 [Lycium barbarum]